MKKFLIILVFLGFGLAFVSQIRAVPNKSYVCHLVSLSFDTNLCVSGWSQGQRPCVCGDADW